MNERVPLWKEDAITIRHIKFVHFGNLLIDIKYLIVIKLKITYMKTITLPMRWLWGLGKNFWYRIAYNNNDDDENTNNNNKNIIVVM